MQTQQIISNSQQDTFALGERLAKCAVAGEVYALFGGLGMGKTALARGFAAGLGFAGEVSSPTFALVHEYRGGRLPLFHFDMYRVTCWDDLYSTGFFDYMDERGILLIEWSENIENALPDATVKVYLNQGSLANQRKIIIERN